MSDLSRRLVEISGYSRDGFADRYDRSRPAPPAALLDLLCRLADVERPRLVVDLGAGTGLSTRAWTDRADEVVGIEPNPEMRSRAVAATDAPNVRFEEAYSNATGLADGCADIVTCSQSLHWMEPEPTFAEVARILRPGGIFAAYDYDLPPVVHPDVDAAADRYHAARGEARRRHGMLAGAERLVKGKEGHLDRMRASGRFRRCREVLVHGIEGTDAERIVGLARSIGPGLEDDVAAELDDLRAVAERVLGDGKTTWHVGYRVRVGVV